MQKTDFTIIKTHYLYYRHILKANIFIMKYLQGKCNKKAKTMEDYVVN